MTHFAKRLRQRREALKLTQNQVADAAGVNRSTIAYYEDGKRVPTLNTLIGISKILEVDLDWLAGLEPDINASESVPVYHLPAPGEPLETEENIIDEELVKRTAQIMFCFVVKDDSMSGMRIYKNDLVCVKKMEKLSSADVVVVDVPEHGVLIRRVILDDENNTIIFHAEEPTVADLVFENEQKNGQNIEHKNEQKSEQKEESVMNTKKPPYQVIGKVAYSKVRGLR